MIRLGTTTFWIDAAATGWWLVRTHGKGKPVDRFGPFTSARHVLQQRQVELPKTARRDLEAFVKAVDGGDAAVDEMPPLLPPDGGKARE